MLEKEEARRRMKKLQEEETREAQSIRDGQHADLHGVLQLKLNDLRYIGHSYIHCKKLCVE
jgi:hypothetical protein